MPPSGEALITPAAGGKLTVDRVTVEFPAGALDSEAVLRLEPLGQIPGTKTRLKMAYAFRATLLHPVTRAEINPSFARPPQVTWAYGGLPLGQAKERNLALYAYDERKQEWELVPSSSIDMRAKTVTALAPHFSVYTYASDPLWDPSQPPAMDGFQTDLMTGAAAYRLPIQVPPGIGGIAPKLAAIYNSTIMDIMNDVLLGQNGGDNYSLGVQASWIGAGWNLDMGYITADDTGYPKTISVNGISDALIQIASGTDSNGVTWREFRTERDSFWRIVWHDKTAINTNQSGMYAEAWDKNGTHFTFGTNYDSECYDAYWPYKYFLDHVEDTLGNYMVLNYFTIQANRSGAGQYDQQVYLDNILYTGNSQTGFQPKFKIVFNRRSRTDVITAANNYWNQFCLDSIDVLKTDGTMIRKYVFGYAYGTPYWYQSWSSNQSRGQPKLLLTSMTVCDTAAGTGATTNNPPRHWGTPSRQPRSTTSKAWTAPGTTGTCNWPAPATGTGELSASAMTTMPPSRTLSTR